MLSIIKKLIKSVIFWHGKEIGCFRLDIFFVLESVNVILNFVYL